MHLEARRERRFSPNCRKCDAATSLSAEPPPSIEKTDGSVLHFRVGGAEDVVGVAEGSTVMTTALGLSLAQRIVLRHGGQLGLEDGAAGRLIVRASFPLPAA